MSSQINFGGADHCCGSEMPAGHFAQEFQSVKLTADSDVQMEGIKLPAAGIVTVLNFITEYLQAAIQEKQPLAVYAAPTLTRDIPILVRTFRI